MKPVIICGGIGTKLWPLSRSGLPKQFIPFLDGKSLFQLNWEALRTCFEPHEIFIQTNELQAKLAIGQVPEITKENIWIEPEMRNQGPATGFCAAKLFARYPDEPFMLIQADVLRYPSASFIDFILAVEQLVLQHHCLVTGIVKPKHGLAGIDFMIPGGKIDSNSSMNVYTLDRWVMREDPDRTELENSKKPLFGHANHYSTTPRILLQMYRDYAPEWYTPLSHMMDAFGTSEDDEVVRREYALMPSGPIEARVANHAMKEGLVVECPFEWIDFGTWDSVQEYFHSAQLENKNLIEVDCKRNFVLSDKLVALVGVDDLVVVDTGDALLITKSGKSSGLSETIQVLKKRNPELL